MDPVSGHFVRLIEEGFRRKVGGMVGGEMRVYERKVVECDGSDLYERLCVFSGS